ncbi:hypothetical protein J4221_01505 [Candidatus Pacearchaeota archaeon]|nr:hypothetical protein [Candidatus Pacearchaeota archaeon]
MSSEKARSGNIKFYKPLLSLIKYKKGVNLDFKPINVKIPGPQIKGNPVGGVGLVIEGVSPTGNVVNENEVNQNAS